MSLSNFSWNDNSRRIKKDSHAIFGASKYHWINYSQEKMIDTYLNGEATKKGTELHETAYLLIKNKIKLPDIEKTFNMYVNDAILFDMKPEVGLYFSDLFYGTADAISVHDHVLRIHDLKTGKTKASLHQLEIYVAFFCLEYGLLPVDFDDIELRIYQNNDIVIGHPGTEEIVPIMDKIVTVDEVIRKLKEQNHE